MTIRNENGAGDITTVTVLGTGVLGSQIAYQTAYSGFEVTAYDISDDILASAKLRFQELAARYERVVDGAGGERARAALARIAYSSDLTEAVRDADLVIEGVPERLDLKRDVYSELAKAAPAKTIFATNSSTLLPSAMAEFTGRPERSSRCTSVTRYGSGTSPRSWAIPTPIPLSSGPSSTLRGGGMEPIELTREQPGYVLNTLLVPFLRAGLDLLVDGVADHETIDKVWRIFARAPEGPFQMIDFIGLNTAYNVSASGDEKAQAIGQYLKENFIDRGKLGVSTGEGFYTYAAAS